MSTDTDDIEIIEISIDAGAAPAEHFLRMELRGEIYISGEMEVYFIDEEALAWLAALVQIEEETADEIAAEAADYNPFRVAEAAASEAEIPPYDAPVHPFYIDEDGDICDANGWLVMVTPYGIWPDVEHHAQTVLKALNKHPFLTPDQMRDKRRAEVKQMMRDQGRLSY